jgi:glycosyltransferase involved in cell wall biosynthesis
MLVRRSALNEIGLFDYEAFPRGYGEENDWCMRAHRAGWEHAVDGTTLVFHGNAASFGEEAKAALGKEARKVIDARYPEYTGLVRSMMASPEIAAIRAAARETFDETYGGGRLVRPAILYVLHAGRGGTPATNLDLMRSLESRYDPYLLTSNGRDLVLSRLVDGELLTTSSWRLATPISVVDETRRDYRQILTEILDRYAIELIHIRHLIGHTFDIGWVAKGLGVPVVLSFHDFYFVCPTVHLLDENDVFCGGTCTPGQGSCRIPTKWLEPVPHLKHDWVNVWKQRASALFANVDAFVTASDSARSTYSSVYPELTAQRFRLMEHGRDLDVSRLEAGITPRPGGPIKIVVPGNLAVHKGSRLIEQLKAHDVENRIEFHFLGDVPEESEGLGIVHGSYERDEFANLVAGIGPAFVAVFTIAGETYSHVITEAWAAGVPVLVTALGAQRERVLRHGAGWIVDHTRPETAYRVILDAVSDPAEYERRRSLCQPAAARTVAEMAADYAQLYEEVWDARRPFSAQPATATPPLRAALFVVGGNGSHPGSVHVRTLRRWMHPELRRDSVAQVTSVDRFLEEPDAFKPDLAVVQRTAIDPDSVPDFIDVCKRRSIPIVFDLDDDLINLPSDSVSYEVYKPFRESLLELAENCALMTVSTSPLRARMESLSANIAIVPNHIDEQLWMRPLLPVEPSPRPLRLLYFGTDTHGQDIELLKHAVTSLEGAVALYVIGGEPPGEGHDWYERIEIPSGYSSYPRFARWLAEMRGDFDSAVIPLVDNEFNRCKSDLKFLEMAALGLPVLASDVVPYSQTIEHRTMGLLVPNTSEGWRSAFDEVAGDPQLRERVRIAAYGYVAEERTLAKTLGQYLDTIGEVADRGNRLIR